MLSNNKETLASSLLAKKLFCYKNRPRRSSVVSSQIRPWLTGWWHPEIVDVWYHSPVKRSTVWIWREKQTRKRITLLVWQKAWRQKPGWSAYSIPVTPCRCSLCFSRARMHTHNTHKHTHTHTHTFSPCLYTSAHIHIRTHSSGTFFSFVTHRHTHTARAHTHTHTHTHHTHTRTHARTHARAWLKIWGIWASFVHFLSQEETQVHQLLLWSNSQRKKEDMQAGFPHPAIRWRDDGCLQEGHHCQTGPH